MVQNIYVIPPIPPEEHHKAIDNIHTIVQGIKTQSYELEVIEKSNEILTRPNTAAMAQLAHMTMTMNDMQAQLRTLVSTPTNQTRSKINYFCWSCRGSYTHGSITYSSKKLVHQEEDYYKKKLVGIEKGRK